MVHVTADNRYRLFVNGKAVGLGPARGDQLHWRYETYDLAPFLAAGKNTVAAMVWNQGAAAPVAQMSLLTGFLMQGNSEAEAAVNTGAQNWLVFRNRGYRPYPVTAAMVNNEYYASGSCDSLDAAFYPWGWEQRDYNEAGWKQAVPIRAAKPAYYAFGHGEGDANLMPRTIPMMEDKLERIPKVVRATGVKVNANFLSGRQPLVIPANTQATILLDQTHLTTAYPELRVSGGKGSSVDIGYAEALFDEKRKKGNRNETENKKLVGYHDAFVPDGGQNRLFRPLWYRTYRFLELTVKTAADPLTIHDVYGIFTAYPFEEKASFASNDPVLKRIWDIGWRTARLCANETYYDCPYYEQLQYIGDTRIQALISLHVSGDDRLMRNALELFHYSRLPEGVTQSRYPTDYPQIIPPFSLFWVAMVHDYHQYRNDPQFVQQFLPGIQGVLSWFENHLAQNKLLGNLQWWNFVDWAPKFSRGVPKGAEGKQGTAIISLQFVYALDRAAALFQDFGKAEQATYYRTLADSIRKAVSAHCFDAGKQLFADTPEKTDFSQHANVLAILTDALPAPQQAALMQKILADTSLTPCSIYFKFYLLQALKKAGMGDQYLEHLGNWKTMLADGLTTFAETDVDTRSDCHAWSASPLVELLATVCGIEPATAGFRTVKIEPHLGRLNEASGRMPHPLGMIEVQLKRRGTENVEAEINLPAGLTGTFVWNGKETVLKSGRQRISL